MDETRRVARATGVIGGATLLSRVFGYVRDMAMAAFLGAGMVSDAFFVAFTIPNLLRRLFAEGALTVVFIPVFTDYLQNRGRAEAFALARSALRLLSVVMLAVTLAGIFLSPLIVHIIGWGWVAEQPDKVAVAVTLTRIMFPYVLLVCLVGLCMGILNALGYFAAPALSPVLLNIAMIVALVGLSQISDDSLLRARGLAWSVIGGGVLQLAVQLPYLVKAGLRFWETAPFYHPGLRKIAWLMLPAVFGAAVYQINLIVGRVLATLLPEGSVSSLYYADRLIQFPLGVFAVSAAMAVLPSFSRQAAAGNHKAIADTLAYSLKLTFFIILPAMIGLIVLRRPIVSLLFERGCFDATAVAMTARALFFYALGLWAAAASRILVSVFYALSDMRTPVRLAVLAALANIVFSLALMERLAHGGLALAASLAAVMNFGLLMLALRTRLDHLRLKPLCVSVTKSTVCAGLMGLVVWCFYRRVVPVDGAGIGLLLSVLAAIGLGLACYLFFAYIGRCDELHGLLIAFKRKFGPNENRS